MAAPGGGRLRAVQINGKSAAGSILGRFVGDEFDSGFGIAKANRTLMGASTHRNQRIVVARETLL